ncbi:MAG TPA: VWA domain-containing protein, partial [Planctomycetaceae bacterium]|nr:VWA domain-containing protein [Planctomycetaceae bacterium]
MSLANAESTPIAAASRVRPSSALRIFAAAARSVSAYTSWMISASVHLLLALLFAGIVAQSQSAVPGLFIDSAFSEPSPGVQPLESVMFESLVPNESPALSDPPHESEMMPAGGESDLVMVPRLGLPVGIGTGAGEGDGEGAEGGSGEPAEPRGIGFFGTYTEGKSVVYVVDMSGSMTGKRFSRAKQELVKSLYRLESQHRYSIVLFNIDAYPLYWPNATDQLLDPSKVNVRRSARWVSSMEPNSFTDPSLALAWGLAREPDVLFFLTDGEIPPATRVLIRELNRKPTIVNTIAFESRAGEVLLRAIAEDHGGTYRYVK